MRDDLNGIMGGENLLQSFELGDVKSEEGVLGGCERVWW